MVWLAGFVLLSVVGLLLASYSRDEDACLLACGLALLSGAAIPAWYGDVLYLLAVVDMLIWCVAFVMWDVRRARWLRSFVTLSALRLGVHVALGLGCGSPLFLHLLNAAFVAQVFIVSRQGGIRLGDRIADRLRVRGFRFGDAVSASSVRLTADG